MQIFRRNPTGVIVPGSADFLGCNDLLPPAELTAGGKGSVVDFMFRLGRRGDGMSGSSRDNLK